MLGTLQSGAPFGATVTNGPLNLLGDQSVGLLRPNLVSSQLVSSAKGKPAAGVRGFNGSIPPPSPLRRRSRSAMNPHPPGVYGPGTVNFDTMLGKNVHFGDRWRAQFRWEMFDTFNTPQFGLPSPALGGSASVSLPAPAVNGSCRPA